MVGFLYSSHKLHLFDRSLPHSEHHAMTHNLSTRTRCINSDQWDDSVPPSSSAFGRLMRGRTSVAVCQLITFWQIAELVVLLVTSKAPAGLYCMFLPAVSSSAYGILLRVDYARRIPRDLRRWRKRRNRGNGGLRCLLEVLVGGVNGSLVDLAHFHFRCCRKDIMLELISTIKILQ